MLSALCLPLRPTRFLPAQVIGAVVDVEFDDVEDVPDILNALTIKVNIEKYNKKNDMIRTASLLPKQVSPISQREAMAPYWSAPTLQPPSSTTTPRADLPLSLPGHIPVMPADP